MNKGDSHRIDARSAHMSAAIIVCLFTLLSPHAIAQSAVNPDHGATNSAPETVKRDSVRQLLTLAVEARAQRDFNSALTHLDAASLLDPTMIDIHMQRAVTHSWSGNLDEALKAYQHAVELDDSAAAPKIAMARVLAWQGKLNAAERIYRNHLQGLGGKLLPLDIEALLGMALVHRLRWEFDAATTLYRRVLTADPSNTEAASNIDSGDGIRRARFQLEGGFLYDSTSTLRATVRTALSYRWSPSWSTFAHYQNTPASSPNTSGLDPDDGITRDQVTRSHVLSVGGRVQNDAEWGVEFEYGVRIDNDEQQHRLALRTNLKLSSETTLIAGVRPGLRSDGRGELLVHAGLQWSYERFWLLAQFFTYANTHGGLSWAPSATFAYSMSAFDFRAGVSSGAVANRALLQLEASVGVNVSDGLRIHISHQHLAEPFTQKNTLIGLSWEI